MGKTEYCPRCATELIPISKTTHETLRPVMSADYILIRFRCPGCARIWEIKTGSGVGGHEKYFSELENGGE
jgi:transposase-like protein